MTSKAERLKYLLAEARRRHVFRVVGAYTVCVFVVLQVADIVLPSLMVPPWVMTALVVLSVLGLPVVAAVAWALDITSEGIVWTEPSGPEEIEPIRWNPRWIDYAIIAVLMGILTFLIIGDDEEEIPREPSIAVLPFTDLSEGGDHGYFCDGMSEALIDSLTRIPGLKVASRTSSFAFRNASDGVHRVAGELGVSTVLEGSVRKSGEQIRIDARLVDGERGYNLWSESYKGTVGDVFALQDNIARSITEVLKVRLTGGEKLVKTATEDDDAYDLYLRGRAELRKGGTLENVGEAMAYFEQALERDGAFGLAMAGLCAAWWQRYEMTNDSNDAETAIESCREARQHENHAETYVALGRLYRGTGRLDQAHEALARALELEPRNADAHAALGRLHLVQGDARAAERDIRRAIELDPEFWGHYNDLGIFFYVQGEYRKAVDEWLRATQLEPASPRPYSNLGGAYVQMGQRLKAADAFDKSIEIQPTVFAYSNAGTNYYYAGNFPEAEAMFSEAASMSPSDYRWQGYLGDAIRMQAGRSDEASEHYRNAIRLAYKRLEVNPTDSVARARAALYLARTGEDERAEKELERLGQADSGNMEVEFSRGLTQVVLGHHENAVEHFRKAVAAGYPRNLLRENPDIEPISEDASFRAVMDDSAHQSVQP